MGTIEVALVLGGVIGLYFFNQARAAGALVLFPGNITGLQFDGATPVVTVTLLVQNPTNTSFVFRSFAASAYSNDTLVGNVSNFTPVAVGPNSEGIMPLTIRLLLITAANDVISIIQTKHVKRTLKLEGTINANGVPVPVTLNYEMGL